MPSSPIIDTLLFLDDEEARSACIEEALSRLDEAEVAVLVEALRERVIRELWGEIALARRGAESILQIARHAGNRSFQALGTRMLAQTLLIGLGERNRALTLYAEALGLYEELGDELGQAETEVTHMWAIALGGDYREAISRGEWAAGVLADHAQWRTWATCGNNLAVIHTRFGRWDQASALLEEAGQMYRQLGADGEPFLPLNEVNRAYILCDLGQFNESVAASERALFFARKLGMRGQVAQATHNLGLTYYLWGHYHKALSLFDAARSVWQEEGRAQELIRTELATTYCLLRLRRFRQVLARTASIATTFAAQGVPLETALAQLNAAQAHMQLRQWDEALAELARARETLRANDNRVLAATIELAQAELFYQRGAWKESREAALQGVAACAQVGRALEEAGAWLVAARAEIARGQLALAEQWVTQALDIVEEQPTADLQHEGQRLLGQVAAARGETALALEHFRQAIVALEQLQARTMIEHRADFLQDADKQALYEDAVALCLDSGAVGEAFSYVERARSRALMTLLDGRLDLRIQARTEADQPMVASLNQLRERRNRLYRQQRAAAVTGAVAGGQPVDHEDLSLPDLEQEITRRWHQLLVRSGEYTREASLAQVSVEAVRQCLAPDERLVAFFQIRDQLVAFIVPPAGAGPLQAVRPLVAMAQVQPLLQALGLNLKTAALRSPALMAPLAANARRLLERLYDLLFAPLEARLPADARLILVPYGPLHYLPFHALYDGEAYLIERREISYLPAASFLNYARRLQTPGEQWLVVGHSQEGRLPYAVAEAKAVARLGSSTMLLEQEATLAAVQRGAAACRLLHFAGHGFFRGDNPLFSGLALADGTLSTLDIFNLSLPASLVTLSACHTGRSVVGGGEELLGLMRAFLAAGTASLLLSHWAVGDEVAAQFMVHFYRHLTAGQTKAAALRAACQALIRTSAPDGGQPYGHPYYWASFFLVGDTGPL